MANFIQPNLEFLPNLEEDRNEDRKDNDDEL